MRLIFGLVLILGVGLAGFAVMMAKDRFDQYQTVVAKQQQKLAKAVDVVEVFVMDKPIRYGEKITKEDVRKVSWPKDAVPEGAYLTETDLFPDEKGRLRTATRAMEANEPVLAVKVTEPGEDAGVSSRLSKGMRAFAISVNVTSGVSGFLRPGDRIDVYWSGTAKGQEVTKLIQSSMQIIGIDQNADMDRTAPTIARTVTVEADPKQVAGLAQAQRTGSLSLSLVGAADEAYTGSIEIDQNELLGIIEEEKVVERAEVEEVCTIRTRRGSEVVEIPIPCTN
ncbi:Flp pilus assembly protein CpaB [Dinoroseobacter sp. S76]|uniref:Flp pilus assembly protein CpaB n=1 Tax=Dinoroseobacter sp. S76 TaxID=3415124 RepID=UPI003C7C6BC5